MAGHTMPPPAIPRPMARPGNLPMASRSRRHGIGNQPTGVFYRPQHRHVREQSHLYRCHLCSNNLKDRQLGYPDTLGHHRHCANLFGTLRALDTLMIVVDTHVRRRRGRCSRTPSGGLFFRTLYETIRVSANTLGKTPRIILRAR